MSKFFDLNTTALQGELNQERDGVGTTEDTTLCPSRNGFGEIFDLDGYFPSSRAEPFGGVESAEHTVIGDGVTVSDDAVLVNGKFPLTLRADHGLVFRSQDGQIEVSNDSQFDERTLVFPLQLNSFEAATEISIVLAPGGRIVIPTEQDPVTAGILLDNGSLTMLTRSQEEIQLHASREVSVLLSDTQRAPMAEYVNNDRMRMLLGRDPLPFNAPLALELGHDVEIAADGTIFLHGAGARIATDTFEYEPMDEGLLFHRSLLYSEGDLYAPTIIDTLPQGRGRILDSEHSFPVAKVVYHIPDSSGLSDNLETVSREDIIFSQRNRDGSGRSLVAETFKYLWNQEFEESVIPTVDYNRLKELDSVMVLGLAEYNKEQGIFRGTDEDYEKVREELKQWVERDLKKIIVDHPFLHSPDNIVPLVGLRGEQYLRAMHSDRLALDSESASTGNISGSLNFFFDGAKGLGGALMGTAALHAFSQFDISPQDLPTDITINGQPLFPEDERGVLQVPVTVHSIVSGYQSVAEEFQAGSSVALRWTEPTLVNRLLDPMREDKRSDRVLKNELLEAGANEEQAKALVDFRKAVKLTRNIDQLHIHRAEHDSVVHLSFRVDAVAMDSGIPILAQGVQVVGGVTQFTIGPVLKGAGEVFGSILSPFGVKKEVNDIFSTPDKLGKLAAGNGEAWATVAIDTDLLRLDNWHLFLRPGQFEALLASLDSPQASGL